MKFFSIAVYVCVCVRLWPSGLYMCADMLICGANIIHSLFATTIDKSDRLKGFFTEFSISRLLTLRHIMSTSLIDACSI